MAGVKGRSGRRVRSVEEKHLAIIDKAWELVGEQLNSNNAKRFELARDIVVKSITQHIKGEGLVGDINVYNILSQLQGKSKDMDNTPLELDQADGLYKR